MATYIKRVEDLERIGLSFQGVEKCFAVQAGRELRVMVRPERIEVSPVEQAEPPATAAFPDREICLRGRVVTLTFRGASTAVVLDCAGLELAADVPNVHGEPPLWLTAGSVVVARMSPSALRLLPE